MNAGRSAICAAIRPRTFAPASPSLGAHITSAMRIVSSPLTRARATAEVLASLTGLGVEIVKRSQDTKGFQVLNRNGDDDTFTPQKEMGKHDPNVNHGTYVDDDGAPRISPDDDRPYLDPDNRPSFRQ